MRPPRLKLPQNKRTYENINACINPPKKGQKEVLEISFTLLWTPDLDIAASYKASMPPLIPCLQCEGIGGCPGLHCTDSGFSRLSDVLSPYLDTQASPQQSKRVSIFNIALPNMLALPFHLCTYFGGPMFVSTNHQSSSLVGSPPAPRLWRVLHPPQQSIMRTGTCIGHPSKSAKTSG